MAFTTQTFIFIFFPVFIFLFYLCNFLQTKGIFLGVLTKFRLNDLVIIGISVCFYMWACFDDITRFALYIIMIYLLGRGIASIRKKNYYILAECENKPECRQHISLAVLLLFLSVAITVYILIHFKYTTLIATVWNFLFKDTVQLKSYLAPLGISFITFSAISYLVDIYNGKAKAGNIIDCALYLLFFPKVVSGPIVLWRDFSKQIKERKVNLNLISSGTSRIMIGFAKN